MKEEEREREREREGACVGNRVVISQAVVPPRSVMSGRLFLACTPSPRRLVERRRRFSVDRMESPVVSRVARLFI